MITKTIDLEAEADTIREDKLSDIQEAQDEMVEKFKDDYNSYENVPDDEIQAFEATQETEVELRGRAEAFERVVEEWGDGVFTIQEFSGGALSSIQDTVAEESFNVNPRTGEMEGTPKTGVAKTVILKHGITNSPDGAPDNPADYPATVYEYLYEKVNNLNTVGDTDLGNSSLQERMK